MLSVGSFIRVTCFSGGVLASSNFSGPYLAALCLAFLAALLARLVTSLVTGMMDASAEDLILISSGRDLVNNSP